MNMENEIKNETQTNKSKIVNVNILFTFLSHFFQPLTIVATTRNLPKQNCVGQESSSVSPLIGKKIFPIFSSPKWQCNYNMATFLAAGPKKVVSMKDTSPPDSTALQSEQAQPIGNAMPTHIEYNSKYNIHKYVTPIFWLPELEKIGKAGFGVAPPAPVNKGVIVAPDVSNLYNGNLKRKDFSTICNDSNIFKVQISFLKNGNADSMERGGSLLADKLQHLDTPAVLYNIGTITDVRNLSPSEFAGWVTSRYIFFRDTHPSILNAVEYVFGVCGEARNTKLVKLVTQIALSKTIYAELRDKMLENKEEIINMFRFLDSRFMTVVSSFTKMLATMASSAINFLITINNRKDNHFTDNIDLLEDTKTFYKMLSTT